MKAQLSRTMDQQACLRPFLAAVAAAFLLCAPVSAQEVPPPDSGNLVEALTGAVKAALAAPPGDQPAADAAEMVAVATQPAADAEPPDIHVSPQGRVEMHVRELDLSSVLQMLSIQSQRNIVASKDVSGRVTANLYNVTFEEALTAILDANNAGWREHGNFIYVYTADELKAMDSASRRMITRLFRLHYTRAQDAQAMIQPLLSSEGKVALTPAAENGIAPSKDKAGGDTLAEHDTLLVLDYPDRVEAVAKLLSEIDVRPQQVLVEAVILRAQLNEDNALGIDFNLVGGVDFQNLNSTSNGVTDLITDGLPQARLNDTTFTTQTDFREAVPRGGFTFGIIKNNVAAFVRALEQVTDTTVLANPKVLTLNKQPGEVVVGRRDGYLTTTVTETSAVQNVEFLETGTQLRFRPFIGADGYVRMEVHPEDSTGGLTAANLPFEQTTEVTTNILVRDGHTILIGGLFREVTTAARDQIPLIGNVPIAGALFRNTRDSTQREEVIILLTVHIIKDADCYAEASRELAEDVERYRVGMRKGLQCFGRERLAQAHYHWAMEHLQKGHTGRAIWDLNLALNNNPEFLAAIQLKEQLLSRRTWDEDSSAVRNFVAEQIMREHGSVEPLFERPGLPLDAPPLEGPNGFEERQTPPAAPGNGPAFGPESRKPAASGSEGAPS